MSGMPRLDVLIHPGGPGTRPLMRTAQHLAWVRVQRDTVPLMTSVWLCGAGPGSYFDLATFSFHVPLIGSCCASAAPPTNAATRPIRTA